MQLARNIIDFVQKYLGREIQGTTHHKQNNNAKAALTTAT
jgi:hypothetical protein